MLSQLENIIMPHWEEEDKNKNTDIWRINSEESKCNNSKSLQISIPEIKIDNKMQMISNPSECLNFDKRRDSDQELANILANAIFQDSGRVKNQSTIKEESMSAFIKDADRMVVDTKDIIVPSSPIKTKTLTKMTTL